MRYIAIYVNAYTITVTLLSETGQTDSGLQCIFSLVNLAYYRPHIIYVVPINKKLTTWGVSIMNAHVFVCRLEAIEDTLTPRKNSSFVGFANRAN